MKQASSSVRTLSEAREKTARPDQRSVPAWSGSKDMEVYTRTWIACSALHLWIILRRVEWVERWNPYVIARRLTSDPNAIRYYFSNNPRSAVRTMFNGTLVIDDPGMTVTIEFGTRNHFRFTETLSIERTPDRQWLRHDLTGEGLGVKLIGRILTRRIRPMMLHANTMLDEFMTSLQAPVERQGRRNVHMQRARFGSASQMKMCANDLRKGDDPCPKT
ncbi:Uncharacterized protein SGRAN_4195 [Sphingopyxis granuli]|uniref:Uncharacterized protein n=2 Tax=Sphingopyxis granuli TaxID=267128 RepID=A0AA86L502_9SPHN|nr:Uncharacterized protein SGRAN_4195 [Sphingopyxis granuli]